MLKQNLQIATQAERKNFDYTTKNWLSAKLKWVNYNDYPVKGNERRILYAKRNRQPVFFDHIIIREALENIAMMVKISCEIGKGRSKEMMPYDLSL